MRCLLVTILSVLLGASAAATAQTVNLAPGFETMAANAKVVVMPTDIELFSISGGGVLEPRADWTEAASRYFKAALVAKKKSLGATVIDLTEKDADELSEVNTLHAAIARSISLHHFGPGFLNLPTKAGKHP